MFDVSEFLQSYVNTLPILLIVLSLYWTTIVGAPWIPSSMRMVQEMLLTAEVRPDDVVYDLGCGDGRIVLAAAMRHHARGVGIEIDPLRYLWCQALVLILGQRKRVRIIFGNMLKQDLSEATVVMCYLLPDALQKLEEKFREELSAGTRIVSNKYVFPTLKHVRENGDLRLYVVESGSRHNKL